MNTKFILKTVSGQQWIQRIAHFRYQVWSELSMIDESLFPGQACLEEVDQLATHLVVMDQDRLVGAARYTQYADINSAHLGLYYEDSGITPEGAAGVPERVVVDPDVKREGIGFALADKMSSLAVKRGASFTISECSPEGAKLVRKYDGPSLGMAPIDPRFPGVRFEWMLVPYRNNWGVVSKSAHK